MSLPPVGPLAIAPFAQTMTRVRRAVGTRLKGRYFPGVATASTITGAVAVPRGDRLLEVPEGRRADSLIRVTSTFDFRSAGAPDQHEPDLLLYEGRYYEVIKAKHIVFAQAYQAVAALVANEPHAARCFFGVGAAGLSPTALEALSVFILSTRDAAFTVTAGASQKVYFALPSSMGSPTFENVTFMVSTQTLEGISYTVAESTSLALGTVTVRVS